MKIKRKDTIEIGSLMFDIESERGKTSDVEIFDTEAGNAINIGAFEIDPEEIGLVIRILEAHANIGMGKADA